MAEVEIVRDLFSNHNPHAFKRHPKGRHLYWANRAWRDRKGYGQLRPVKANSEEWKELQQCLAEAPLDIDNKGTNLIHRGDTILAVMNEEDWQAKQDRRSYLANYKQNRLTKTNLVAEELNALGNPENVVAQRQQFSHTRSIQSGKARG